jgi:hypothetical protein
MAVDSPSCIGLPRIWGGSASTTVLSGPSQGSLALRPARLLQPLRLTFVPEASAGRSPCPTAQVTTGMNRQFPGRDSHPLVICAFVAHPYIVVTLQTGCVMISYQNLNLSYDFGALRYIENTCKISKIQILLNISCFGCFGKIQKHISYFEPCWIRDVLYNLKPS